MKDPSDEVLKLATLGETERRVLTGGKSRDGSNRVIVRVHHPSAFILSCCLGATVSPTLEQGSTLDESLEELKRPVFDKLFESEAFWCQ